jgi:hypothetical protein
MLASTLHSDFQLSVETNGALESFKAIRADVLLLGGSKSSAYFKVALDALEKVLPHAKRTEFPRTQSWGLWQCQQRRQA